MDYSDLVLDHFFKPRNVGCFSNNIPNIYTAKRGEVGVSDIVQLQVQLDESGTVIAARFKAYGNPYTIAAMSWLTEQIIDQSLVDITLTYQGIMEALAIPQIKQASALLVEDVLKLLKNQLIGN